MNAINNKTCSKCGIKRSVGDFYVNSRYADGYQGVCRICQRERMRELELSGARDSVIKKYRQSEKGKAARSKNQSDYAKRNPEKCRAHSIVNNAVASGKIIRGKCSVCGKGSAHAHHEDYARPLEIIWLCSTHHVQHHLRCGG